MALDRATDAISHFIGLFELKVEQGRLRDAYDEFDALRRKAELGPVETQNVRIPTDLDLDPSKYPPLGHVPEPPALPPIPLVPLDYHSSDVAPSLHAHDFPYMGLEHSALPLARFDYHLKAIAPDPSASLELPGSVVTVTVQTALLYDDDTLGEGTFRDSADHVEKLADLAAQAASFHAPGGPGAAEFASLDSAMSLAEAMRTFSPEATGATTFTLHGTDIPARIVNGEAVDELPVWNDLLPPHLAPSDEDEEDDTGIEDWALPEGHSPEPDMPDGYSLVTGGNLLVNEAQIHVAWIDAPMIAVGGQWLDLDVISQVAALSDHDTGLPEGRTGPASVYQVIEIEEEALTAPWLDTSTSDPGAPPLKLSVEILTGDLFVSNYVSQIIDLIDNDHFGSSITAANAAYVLGDNTVTNVTDILQIGLGYDLILISGDFIQIDTIHQTLVLLDDDVVEGAIPPLPKAKGADEAPADDPLEVQGVAVAAEGGIGSSEEDTASTESDIATRAQSGTDGATRAETGADAADEAEESPWQAASDNLLMNQASLNSIGIDTAAELSQSLSAMLHDPDMSLETLKEQLLSDPALAGLEQARVLKIDGSLIQANVIEQTIRASDNDDIRIDGAVPPELDLVAGSNALLNAAKITAHGVDSIVMAENDAYSDLLIHQASLIDEPDMPPEADPGLVSEAVAFLIEDAQAAAGEKMADAFASAGDHITADGYDVMQSALG